MLKERGTGETRTVNENSEPPYIFKLHPQRERMFGVRMGGFPDPHFVT